MDPIEHLRWKYDEKVSGILESIICKNDNGVTLVTKDNGSFEIFAMNDCCGHSIFDFPENFDDQVEAALNKRIVFFGSTEVDNLNTLENLNFHECEYPPCGETEMENYLFNLEVSSEENEEINVYFGVRSFHNGYYPVDISIHHTFKNVGQYISNLLPK